MPHLSQIIAIEKDVKEKAAQSRGHAESTFSKSNVVLSGISRTYKPKDEEGEQLPSEATSVQIKVKQVLSGVQSHLVTLFDTTATKDWANCQAKASITVDGNVLLKDAPATYILFLEKQLAELLSFVKKIPTLDASEVWHYDEGQDCYATNPAETVRSKKIKQTKMAFEGNQHHPPQILVWDEDVPAGRWKTIKFSGAIPAKEVNEIAARIEAVQRAVKFAREEANRSTVEQKNVGAGILNYIFG
jgi:hypothetical protein